MTVQTLIDRAAQIVGSRYKLAQALGVEKSQVYDWESGAKTCSPADRARIAGFANEDAVQELVRATIDSAKGEVRREQLQTLLGKSLRRTGEVLGIGALGLVSLHSGADYFIRCILC